MLISTTVQMIAEAIAASRLTLSASQQARINVLRSLPSYTEAKDLGAWDEAYGQPPSSEPNTTLDLLLDEVFEFGRYNLYCAFDSRGTKRVYLQLARQLRQIGVDCPIADEFTGF